MKTIPHYDLHVTQRDKNILDYNARGARDVIKIQTAYEPTLHFAPPEGWSDADRDRDAPSSGPPTTTVPQSSPGFGATAASPSTSQATPERGNAPSNPTSSKPSFRDGELYRDDYRNAIWRSRINLSFLTHSNQDEFVHKSFEIAGCGGFLLAERSEGHLQRFQEDEEAVFFSTFDELVAKIRRYLPDEAARRRIAKAGNLRAARDGYHNDRQVQLILERMQSILETRRPSRKIAAAIQPTG